MKPIGLTVNLSEGHPFHYFTIVAHEMLSNMCKYLDHDEDQHLSKTVRIAALTGKLKTEKETVRRQMMGGLFGADGSLTINLQHGTMGIRLKSTHLPLLSTVANLMVQYAHASFKGTIGG